MDWMDDQAAQAVEIARPLRSSQWLSQIMKPSSGQSLAVSQVLNSLMTAGVAQKLDPPAEVEASRPISSFFPSIPLQPTMGGTSVGRFLQLMQTSCRYPTEPPAKLSQPLLQACGWQKSMEASARLTMGTKQFQGCPGVSGVGTKPTLRMTATSSGETMMSLLGPMAWRRALMALATVRGVAMQFSMSRSTPSRPQVTRMEAIEAMKLSMLLLVANTNGQLPFCPPTEISTFFPLACHFSTSAAGKFPSSTSTLPSACGFANAKITNFTLGLTSSVVDCPQKSPPNPQQKMETGRLCTQTRAARSRIINEAFINITVKIKQSSFTPLIPGSVSLRRHHANLITSPAFIILKKNFPSISWRQKEGLKNSKQRYSDRDEGKEGRICGDMRC